MLELGYGSWMGKSFGGGPTKLPKNGFSATDPKPRYYQFQDQKMFSW